MRKVLHFCWRRLFLHLHQTSLNPAIFAVQQPREGRFAFKCYYGELGHNSTWCQIKIGVHDGTTLLVGKENELAQETEIPANDQPLNEEARGDFKGERAQALVIRTTSPKPSPIKKKASVKPMVKMKWRLQIINNKAMDMVD